MNIYKIERTSGQKWIVRASSTKSAEECLPKREEGEVDHFHNIGQNSCEDLTRAILCRIEPDTIDSLLSRLSNKILDRAKTTNMTVAFWLHRQLRAELSEQ